MALFGKNKKDKNSAENVFLAEETNSPVETPANPDYVKNLYEYIKEQPEMQIAKSAIAYATIFKEDFEEFKEDQNFVDEDAAIASFYAQESGHATIDENGNIVSRPNREYFEPRIKVVNLYLDMRSNPSSDAVKNAKTYAETFDKDFKKFKKGKFFANEDIAIASFFVSEQENSDFSQKLQQATTSAQQQQLETESETNVFSQPQNVAENPVSEEVEQTATPVEERQASHAYADDLEMDSLRNSRKRVGQELKFSQDHRTVSQSISLEKAGMQTPQTFSVTTHNENLLSVTQDGKMVASFKQKEDGTLQMTASKEFIESINNSANLNLGGNVDENGNFVFDMTNLKLTKSGNLDTGEVRANNTAFAIMFSALGSQIRDSAGNRATQANTDKPFDITVSTNFIKYAVQEKNGCSMDMQEPIFSALMISRIHLARETFKAGKTAPVHLDLLREFGSQEAIDPNKNVILHSIPIFRKGQDEKTPEYINIMLRGGKSFLYVQTRNANNILTAPKFYEINNVSLQQTGEKSGLYFGLKDSSQTSDILAELDFEKNSVSLTELSSILQKEFAMTKTLSKVKPSKQKSPVKDVPIYDISSNSHNEIVSFGNVRALERQAVSPQPQIEPEAEPQTFEEVQVEPTAPGPVPDPVLASEPEVAPVAEAEPKSVMPVLDEVYFAQYDPPEVEPEPEPEFREVFEDPTEEQSEVENNAENVVPEETAPEAELERIIQNQDDDDDGENQSSGDERVFEEQIQDENNDDQQNFVEEVPAQEEFPQEQQGQPEQQEQKAPRQNVLENPQDPPLVKPEKGSKSKMDYDLNPPNQDTGKILAALFAISTILSAVLPFTIFTFIIPLAIGIGVILHAIHPINTIKTFINWTHHRKELKEQKKKIKEISKRRRNTHKQYKNDMKIYKLNKKIVKKNKLIADYMKCKKAMEENPKLIFKKHRCKNVDAAIEDALKEKELLEKEVQKLKDKEIGKSRKDAKKEKKAQKNAAKAKEPQKESYEKYLTEKKESTKGKKEKTETKLGPLTSYALEKDDEFPQEAVETSNPEVETPMPEKDSKKGPLTSYALEMTDDSQAQPEELENSSEKRDAEKAPRQPKKKSPKAKGRDGK